MSDHHQLPHLLSRFRGALVSVGLFSFFFNLLVLTLPLYMLSVFTRVLTSKSEETLVLLTVAALAALMMQGLLDMIRTRIMSRVGMGLDAALTPQVLEAVVRDSAGSGRRNIQPLSDVAEVRNFLSGSGLFALFDAPFAPLYVAVIYILHPDLGTLALVGALVLFAIAMVNEAATRKPIQVVSAHSQNTEARIQEFVRNADTIEAMGMMPAVLERWRAHTRDGISGASEITNKATAANSLAKFVRMALQIGLFGTGAYLYIQHELAAGAMIAASILMGRALAPVESAIGTWRNVVGAKAAYGRLRQVLASDRFTQYRDRMKLPRPSGRVELERVVVMAPASERLILKGVSLALQPGEFLGVIGPSGAGKTTLSKVLVGILPPRGGAGARLDGAELASWHPDDLGQYVGYLPQDVQLFPGTVRENIARMAPESDPDEVIKAAKLAGVHDIILSMPKGYDSDIGDAGRFLSAGQRQHIGLARAFYGNPALLVLDEPNSNLDSVSEDALSEALAGAKERGVTIVVVTHRPSVLRASDQLLLLKDGSVELYGPSEGVMARMRQGALPHEKRERIGADDKVEAKQPAAAGAEKAQRSQGQNKPKQSRPARRARTGGSPPKPQPAPAPRKAPEVIVNRGKSRSRDTVHDDTPPRPVIESSVVRADTLLVKGDNK